VDSESIEHVDVLIVGAGIAGIAAAYHLQDKLPHKSSLILEARDAIGGTWDIFRFPGVRSDSDMATLGFSFQPWVQDKAIADGASILQYLRDAASAHGIDRKIRFQHRVKSASWSSADAQWTVDVQRGPLGETVRFSCGFLFICSGYINHAAGHMPEFPGIQRFAGRVVHPQQWTDDVEHAGQRVVVIGSGATAMTLLPELAKRAAHVTMLQRSPTYVLAQPQRDRIANALRLLLPNAAAHRVARWKNVLKGTLFFSAARRYPERVKQFLIGRAKRALGPQYDIDTHFTPRYKPWDQRLCLVPDGDLFAALQSGRASVVTDTIDGFTETGIRVASGQVLEADLIVAATGLEIQLMGNIAFTVDGRPIDIARTYNYKGLMFSDVPNLAASFGYTNISWTLKCELTVRYVCRLLRHMERNGLRQCTVRNRDPANTKPDGLDFSPGYVIRALSQFPRQGAKPPWKPHQNHLRDLFSLRYGALNDGVMEFS
jgi:cation diffusion facilitator CzcD-associated flavoprotein CzcO